jgi:preprotein translocase subunit SecD
MMEVKFENHGNLILVHNGRLRIEIPRGAGGLATTIQMPFNSEDEADSVLSKLAEKYPTLSYSIIKEEVAPVEIENETEGNPLIDEEDESEADDQQDGENVIKLTIEDFKAKVAKVTKKGAGWWTVEIAGIDEPIKVRGADAEEDAIRLAYEDYVEDFT